MSGHVVPMSEPRWYAAGGGARTALAYRGRSPRRAAAEIACRQLAREGSTTVRDCYGGNHGTVTPDGRWHPPAYWGRTSDRDTKPPGPGDAA